MLPVFDAKLFLDPKKLKKQVRQKYFTVTELKDESGILQTDTPKDLKDTLLEHFRDRF